MYNNAFAVQCSIYSQSLRGSWKIGFQISNKINNLFYKDVKDAAI